MRDFVHPSVRRSISNNRVEKVKTLFPPLPTCPQLITVYPALFIFFATIYLILSTFFFFLSLYPSAQSLSLPLSNYTLLNENLHKKAFKALSERLMSADSSFFASKATNERLSYLCEVEVEFDRLSVKEHSLDYSNFPSITETDRLELTHSQRAEYEKCHTKTSKIPKKLVSDLKSGIFVDHIDMVFMMIVFFGAKITRVHNIVSFNVYDFLRPFSSKMSYLRANTVSTVLKSVYKNYSVAVCGKLHASQHDYLSTTIIDSEKSLDAALDDPNFVDVVSLGQNCALAMADGTTIFDRTVTSISSKIYSTSKVNQTPQ